MGTRQHTAQLVVRMPQDLLQQLRSLADADRRNLSDFIRIKLEDIASEGAA